MNNRGFTLMELLIAILILAIVMAAIYGGFAGTVKISNELQAQISLENNFRIFAERFIDDVESIITISNAGFFLNLDSKSKHYFKTEDIRDREQGVFLSVISDPFCPIGEEYPRKGPSLVSYQIELGNDGEGYVIKRRAIPLVRNFGQREDVILRNVKALEIYVVDKDKQIQYEWNTFESNAELPKMVVLNLTLDGSPWNAADLSETLYVSPVGIGS